MIELKSHFEQVTLAPADAILGLVHDFIRDPRPNKINLAVGVYQTEEGKTWVLPSVQEAEKTVLDKNKDYLPIDGDEGFIEALLKLNFSQRNHTLVGFQTPGGTAALRVGAEFLKSYFPKARVYISSPSWPNHRQIFERAFFEVVEYPYYQRGQLLFDEMIASMDKMRASDIMVLHVCCHNPTGADLSEEQWQFISQKMKEKQIFPFLDFAYQGFAKGLEEDRFPLDFLRQEGHEFFVATSLAKNFGLYGERVGLLGAQFSNEKIAVNASSQIRRVIRALYSNPPLHGALIVKEILESKKLFLQWREEVAFMRQRLIEMRSLFNQVYHKRDVTHEKGMFSILDLEKNAIEFLRAKYAIYLPLSGRISFAGLNRNNIETVAKVL